MAAVATKLRGAVEPAARWALEAAGEKYGKLMAENAKHVVKDAAKVDAMPRQYFFSKLAECVTRAPPPPLSHPPAAAPPPPSPGPLLSAPGSWGVRAVRRL